MRLIVKRDQKAQTGLFGGHKGMSFLLSCRLDLTPEETALVAKYKLDEYPLTFRKTSEGNDIPSMTVRGLTQGNTWEVKDITVLLGNESAIKSACGNFKALLDVSATFGGEEIVEITGNSEE
jgi:hypothetical protein